MSVFQVRGDEHELTALRLPGTLLAVSHAGSSAKQAAETFYDASLLQRAVAVGDAAPVGQPPWKVAVKLISSDFNDTLAITSDALDASLTAGTDHGPALADEVALGRGVLSQTKIASSLPAACPKSEASEAREGCVADDEGRDSGVGAQSGVVWVDSEHIHLLQGNGVVAGRMLREKPVGCVHFLGAMSSPASPRPEHTTPSPPLSPSRASFALFIETDE